MIRNLDFVFMIDQIFLSSYYKNNFLHKNAFQGPGFFRVQVFQGPGFSGSRFFRVQVFQDPAPSFISSLALHIQLVHAFVEQMPLNTIFSLKPFENRIN